MVQVISGLLIKHDAAESCIRDYAKLLSRGVDNIFLQTVKVYRAKVAKREQRKNKTKGMTGRLTTKNVRSFIELPPVTY